MCGINGLSYTDEVAIQEMNRFLHHRGPDDRGKYVDEFVSLGSTRLAIQDLSSKGHQPMRYVRDGREVVIAFNGEIYNFHEIREELKNQNFDFETETDTEVILASYLRWGHECVNRFIGMWSFVIYDKNSCNLFLSRDRFGIKPLYYYANDGRMIFSSEIKPILSQGIARKANDRVIFDYLFYNMVDHTEDTFFQGIKRLMPGNNAVFDLRTRKFSKWEYYNLDTSVKEAVNVSPEAFKNGFLNSVRYHLVSDVPVGSCLSGGIDSSSIVCGLRMLNPKGEIKSFSLVFPGLNIDETEYQEAVAEKAGVNRFVTTFGMTELLDTLNDLIETQEEPFVGLSVFGQYKLMELASRNKMKVLLDGQGADEILAGYTYFSSFYFYELLRKMKFMTLLREFWRYRNDPKGRVVQLFLGLLAPEWAKVAIISHEKNYLSKSYIKRYSRPLNQRFRRTFLSQALIDAVKFSSLPALLRYEDKNSMHWSIESRVPFVDYSFISLCMSLPSTDKIRNGRTKSILRSAMVGLVPDKVLDRREKIGFATPEGRLAQEETITNIIKSIITSDSFKNRPYWNWIKISERYLSGKKGTKGSLSIFQGEELWRIVILELWFRFWIDTSDVRSDPSSLFVRNEGK